MSRRASQEIEQIDWKRMGGNWLYQEEELMRSRETNVGKHEECKGSLKVKQFRKKLFFKIQGYRRLLGEGFA